MRPHPFAAERVGFVSVRATGIESGTDKTLLLLAQNYYPVADHDYMRDHSVGAMIGQEALRKALEIGLMNPVGMFHVHMHVFPGRLWFSGTDLREQVRFVPDFFSVRRTMPHGALVLSPENGAGRVWLAPNVVHPISEFNTMGASARFSRSANDGSADYA